MSRLLGLVVVGLVCGCMDEDRPAPRSEPAPLPVFSPRAVEQGPPPGKGQVRGRVVDDLADPVVGAEVVVAPMLGQARLHQDPGEATRRTYTDALGRFTLDLPPAADLALAVRTPYFRPWRTRGELVIEADATLDLGDVALEPAPGLVVEVVARESQQAVAGARVQLRPALEDATLPGVVLGMFRRNARTHADGHAPLYAVGAGAYSLRVEAEGYATVEIPHQQPATVTTALRNPVQLQKGASLEGRVVREGKPVAGALITCRAKVGWLSHETMSDARGEFRLSGLVSQPYQVLVTHAELGPLVTTLDPGTHHTLELSQGHAIEGRVLDRVSRRPVAGAVVEVLAGSGWPALARGSLEQPKAVTDARGGFRIGGLPAGIVSVAAVSEGCFAEAGPLKPGSGPITLLLRAGTRVTGKIQDPTGQPVTDAHVQVIPRHEQPSPDGAEWWLLAGVAAGHRPLPHTATGSSGRFDLEGLPAGNYRLLVRKNGLAPFLSKAFAASPRGSEDLGTLELPAGGTIQGVARDRSGRPVAGATVCLDPLSGLPPEAPGARTVSNAQGRFALGPVAPGHYQMFYYSRGTQTAAEAAASRHTTLVRVQILDRQGLTQDLHPRAR